MAPKRLPTMLEPLAKHYNGLGMLRPTECVLLRSGTFMQEFEALWDEHVDFGTARSHKKLLKRDREGSEWKQALAAKQASDVAPSGPTESKSLQKKAKRGHAGAGTEAGAAADASDGPAPLKRDTAAIVRPRPLQSAKAVALPNKGRWGSTLAMQLLGPQQQ